uniref:Putative elbow b n=1 Tax=Corethrella appendiculata TaxID=1370023 RepID=U5EYP2_9DIPT
MVILEGTTMLQVGNNQYIQPDYLPPLPTTLDSKKSPLALLAMTCSQIGADSGNINTKSSLVSPLDNKNNSSSNNSTNNFNNFNKKHDSCSRSPSVKTEKSDSSPEIKLAFKPYEMNVLTTKHNSKNNNNIDDRPSSKTSSVSDNYNNNNNNNNIDDKNNFKKEIRVLSRNSESESPNKNSNSVNNNKNSEDNDNNKNSPDLDNNRKTVSPNDGGADKRSADNSPIIRSGLEILHGSKDMPSYKTGGYGINPLTGLPSPNGIDPTTNPAFRPPFAGAFTHHQAAMLAAAGYPSGATSNPYLSYTRVKTPSGGETLVPICKDPYCTGCQFSAHNHIMMSGGQCPAGCTQCEQQKYSLAMAMSSLPPGYPYATAAQQQPGRPYCCNWVVGDSYCGKRFNTMDELLSHFRSHTTNLSDPTALALQQSLMPLGIFPPSPLSRPGAYGNPPLSPLSAARFHPYAKPGALPGSPYPFNPTAFGQYYPPYTLYGQRMGAAVHQ